MPIVSIMDQWKGFWGILKREMYYKQRFNDRSSLITAIANYIDYYNNQRLQRKLHVMTPMEYHNQYTKVKYRQP